MIMQGTGVLGGTFDPVHKGHLQLATGMRDLLGLGTVRLIPNHVPPHRAQPLASVAQRCAMLELALRDQRGLVLDSCELQRPGPSYAVDTMAAVRQQVGSEAALYFLLGSDAFAGLDSWHQWQRLPRYCHLAVALRPGTGRSELQQSCGPALQELLKRSQSEPAPSDGAAGALYLLEGDWPDISATRVRAQKTGTGIAAVDAYMEQQGLYGHGRENN